MIERLPTILPTGQFARHFQKGELKILMTKDEGRCHISVSHPDRYPTWDELKEIRYDLGPKQKPMAIVLPPQSAYVNIHQNCFHIWEIRDEFSEWMP